MDGSVDRIKLYQRIICHRMVAKAVEEYYRDKDIKAGDEIAKQT